MQRLATAAGGNRIAEIENGALEKSFLGYPVVIAQVLPKASATNQVACLFGNLRLAASLGDRRITTIQMSEHALNAFEQDEVAIRGTERFDIVVHDVGDNAGNTGPIVGLITGAS
jgi:HK97 family phage major capsid protein